MSKKNEIVLIAKKLLEEKIGIIEASRILVKLQYENHLEDDTDLKLFWIIDSETDHLPIGEQRENCSTERLLKIDEEIALCKNFYKNSIETACRNLIKKHLQ